LSGSIWISGSGFTAAGKARLPSQKVISGVLLLKPGGGQNLGRAFGLNDHNGRI
jgi:hypothetical protein